MKCLSFPLLRREQQTIMVQCVLSAHIQLLISLSEWETENGQDNPKNKHLISHQKQTVPTSVGGLLWNVVLKVFLTKKYGDI